MNRSALLLVQRTAGNTAATTLLSRNRAVVPRQRSLQRSPQREVYTPREPPARTTLTVERAKKLKVDVDKRTQTLLTSALELSRTATPAIEQFVAGHRASTDTLREILKPYLPGSGPDWGTVLSYAIGVGASLLPVPARAFYEIAKELVVETVQSAAGSRVSDAQKAMEEAKKGLMLATWLTGASEAGDAAARAGSVVIQNYDSATELQLAVLGPWNDLTDAQSRGDQAKVLDAAVRFVAGAPTFIRESNRAATASNTLVVSYVAAALSNSEGDELRRKMAVVLPAVLDSLGDLDSPGADYTFGPFAAKVLAHFYPEIRQQAFGRREAGQHSIADLYRHGKDLLARETGADPHHEARFDPTLEYRGVDLGVFRGEATLTRLHDLAEEAEQTSLPSVADAVMTGEPWVRDKLVVVRRGGHGGGSSAAAALAAAGRHAVAAREHWGRIAGVVPD